MAHKLDHHQLYTEMSVLLISACLSPLQYIWVSLYSWFTKENQSKKCMG